MLEARSDPDPEGTVHLKDSSENGEHSGVWKVLNVHHGDRNRLARRQE